MFKKFRLKLVQASKIGFKVLGKVLAGKRFHFAKSSFSGLHFVWQSQVSKIGFKVLAIVSASLAQAFSPGSFFLAKFTFSKVSF